MIVSVVFPSSVLSVEHGLLLKTLRIYQFIRYSSIFGVDEVFVYWDRGVDYREHVDYTGLFIKIANYLLTPPYLRRRLIPIDSDLRFVGTLPPLRLEAYSVSREGFIGEKRVGVLVKNGYVDIGLKKLFRVAGDCRVFRDRYVYVSIESIDPPITRCVDEEPYLGPLVSGVDDLVELLNRMKLNGYYIIATSRRGVKPSLSELSTLRDRDRVVLLFGSPKHGLYEILSRYGYELEDLVDSVWNTIPGQRVKTVRTEEALLITLALLNIFRYI